MSVPTTELTKGAESATSRAPDAGKHVYFFGGGQAEGTKDMKAILGGKGANLAEMTNLGVPVPPGFTICAASRRSRASASATLTIHCSSRCARALRYRCPG